MIRAFFVAAAIAGAALATAAGAAADDNSRHEQFSDTLFWTITLVFK